MRHRASPRPYSMTTDGLPHLILDGKIFETDRCRTKTTSVKGEQIDAWYSGKTHDFGGNVQALFEPGGFPIWTSDVEPGHTIDITAARAHVLPAARPAAATMPILADPGYQGARHGVHVPFKHPTDGNELHVDNPAAWIELPGARRPPGRGVDPSEGRALGTHR